MTATATTTTSTFNYVEPGTWDPSATTHPAKAWAKVDGPGKSYRQKSYQRTVTSLRGQESSFDTDRSGFQLVAIPSREKAFNDEAAIRGAYYNEVVELLRKAVPEIEEVVVFDHTVRRNKNESPRKPVRQVHVDQTPEAAAARVRKHVTPQQEVERWLKGRYQIVNVWRPIGHPASDFPLAVLDWRSTAPEDFVRVDLLYPKSAPDDGAGKEVPPEQGSEDSFEKYEVRGETYGVAPNENHRFYFVKDMKPDEALLLKCFDSRGERVGGPKGIADGAPHSAFIDPDTPAGSPGRESIEVRCLVLYK